MLLLSTGVYVELTGEGGMMFNASALYSRYYSVRHSKLNHIPHLALCCFLGSPVIQHAFNILKDSNLLLESRIMGSNAVYLHIGFLGLALIDLRLLATECMSAFHSEVRELAAQMREEKQVLRFADLQCFLNEVDRLLIADSEDRPVYWIEIEAEEDLTSTTACASPRTRHALSHLSASPMKFIDRELAVAVSLHTLFVTIDSKLAGALTPMQNSSLHKTVSTEAEVADSELEQLCTAILSDF